MAGEQDDDVYLKTKIRIYPESEGSEMREIPISAVDTQLAEYVVGFDSIMMLAKMPFRRRALSDTARFIITSQDMAPGRIPRKLRNGAACG